jgi:DNA-directed RNA polymerase subunit RPC12/RpoP
MTTQVITATIFITKPAQRSPNKDKITVLTSFGRKAVRPAVEFPLKMQSPVRRHIEPINQRPMIGLNRMKENMRSKKNSGVAKTTSNQKMKCPQCGRVANFSYFFTNNYGAPVVLEGSTVAIDYDNTTGYESHDDGDTCRCGKCGSEVLLDDIAIVEIENDGTALKPKCFNADENQNKGAA